MKRSNDYTHANEDDLESADDEAYAPEEISDSESNWDSEEEYDLNDEILDLYGIFLVHFLISKRDRPTLIFNPVFFDRTLITQNLLVIS